MSSDLEGWRLMNPSGADETHMTQKSTSGLEFTIVENTYRYFSAPTKYLGNQLYSYWQRLIVNVSIVIT